MGAQIVNCSWGKFHYTKGYYDLMKEGAGCGVSYVAAAGNGGTNVDRHPMYPACFKLPNVLSIMASQKEDDPLALGREVVTNFGPRTILVASPGARILTTAPLLLGDRAGFGRAYPKTFSCSIATACCRGKNPSGAGRVQRTRTSGGRGALSAARRR